MTWNPHFFTKWFDPLDLSYRKKLLDLVYIHPWGVRTGIAIFFFDKVSFLKHPNGHWKGIISSLLKEWLLITRTWSIGLSLKLSQSLCREHKLLLRVDPAIWNTIRCLQNYSSYLCHWKSDQMNKDLFSPIFTFAGEAPSCPRIHNPHGLCMLSTHCTKNRRQNLLKFPSGNQSTYRDWTTKCTIDVR